MSIQSYRKTIKETANPRAIEYNLLAKITAEMNRLSMAEPPDKKALYEVLFQNRRLWSHFAIDCGKPGNELPAATRAAIISLSIFVGKHSSKVVRAKESLQPLININQSIMEGLSGTASG